MRPLIALFAYFLALTAPAQIGSQARFVMADTNGVVAGPTNFWTANLTPMRLALDLNTSINSGTPNGAGALVHWSKLVGVPAGFADGSDDGAGGGGSNFIASVSADFQVLASALSLTNVTGSGQILRESTLAPYLLSATADATYQPGTPTLARLGGIGLGVSGDWLYRDANGWTNASSAVAEALLEALLDLQDFQGAVTDAQVPNTITVDNATTAATANAGDSATAFFSAGQVERSRGGTGADTSAFGAGLIGSDGSNATVDVDTESELEAALGGLDVVAISSDDVTSADLRFAVADETGTGALVFAGGNIGAATATDDPYDATAWNGSNKVPTQNAVRDKIESMSAGSGGDVYQATNNTFTAANQFNGTVGVGSLSRTNWAPTQQEAYAQTEFLFGSGGTTTTMFLPWQGNAITSGTSAAVAGASNHIGIISISSAAGANSGYAYIMGATIAMNRPGDFSRFVWRPQNTNAGVREYLGWIDQGAAATAPVDGLYLFRSNNFVCGQAANNSAVTQTATSTAIQSNLWYSGHIQILSDAVSAFALYSETGSLVWADTVTNGVSMTRSTGHGLTGSYTNAAAAVISHYDFMSMGNYLPLVR